MPVVVQTPFNQHTGNGVTTLFGFTFQLLEAGDLEVSLDGVVQPSGFTISGLGVQAGGSITFNVAPGNGVIVDIRRRIPLARSTDYQVNGDLPSDQVDRDYDRLWQAMQDAAFDDNLSVKLPVADAAAPMVLPSATERASKFMAFDASGQAIAADTIAGDVIVSAFMETLLDDADAAAGRTTLGVPSTTDLASAIAALTTAITNATPPGASQGFWRASAPTGWVKANGQTIGSAASGATGRANDDTRALFDILWADFTNTTLPIQTSAGGASTRGASAAADWAANKRITLPDMRGEFPRGWDDGKGTDAARVLGSSQTDAMQGHRHAGDFHQTGGTAAWTGTNSPGLTLNPTTSATPGNPSTDGVNGTPRTAAETRPRNVAMLYCIKL